MNAHPDPIGVIPERPESQSSPPTPAHWRDGAEALRRHQLGDLAAMCLEAVAPLALAASQFLYAAVPFFGSRAMELARLLESETAISALTQYLTTDVDGSPAGPGVAHD